MDAAAIDDFFEPIGAVRCRRMFGGHGVYRDGRMFALEAGGELYLKTDAETRAAFEAAGSQPFVFESRGKRLATSYWRTPDEALDDPEALRRWCALAFAAAQRAGAAKTGKAKAGKMKTGKTKTAKKAAKKPR